MPELSPAAAILAAFRERYDETLRPGPFVDRWQAACLAAALTALADQVVPESQPIDSEEWLGQSAWSQAEYATRFKILAIAAELRGETTTTEPHP